MKIINQDPNNVVPTINELDYKKGVILVYLKRFNTKYIGIIKGRPGQYYCIGGNETSSSVGTWWDIGSRNTKSIITFMQTIWNCFADSTPEIWLIKDINDFHNLMDRFGIAKPLFEEHVKDQLRFIYDNY